MTLARQLVGRGTPLLNLLFHSSEAIVGGSPYNKTEGELTAFFEEQARLGGATDPESLGVQLTMVFDGAGAYSVVRGGASPAARAAAEALLAAQGL